MKNKIENVLIELGISPNLLGFDYICNAMEIITNSKDKPKIVDLYMFVAHNFDSSVPSVERAIRTAFSNIDFESDAYNKYIGISKRTNGTLLFTLYMKTKEC